ncbi:MAG: hypothetical protein NTX40_01790 [Planctomycetota bacterium]|nr:hypothetical protein [Planctomycetota bacterium]
MKQHASVLVVVLGLLAILAVIGVAFLALSSLERSTATSFALQTQMMIAADGALDYAIHQMVTDVWEWNIPAANKFEFTGKLLTGRQAGLDPIDGKTYGACEPYDFPSAAVDPWLSTPIVSNATPAWISFGNKSENLFWIKFGSQVTGPDNLGMPVTTPAKNGIWIPDLAAPCDQYLVRASVTILDHGALLNMNAHGSKDTGAWEYGDCIGKGYFVSDVLPGPDLNTLLTGTGSGAGSVPGCWGADAKPGNSMAGAVLIENPYAGQDVPFTLDEEFELRNLFGTYFQSRLEQFWPALPSDPANANAYTPRLKTTTVSWTAEVRGDGAGSHATMKNAAGTTDFGWSAAKVDLNTASADAIYEALRDGRAWEDTGELKQLVANIVAFRSRKGFDFVSIGGANYVGANRQAIFSEVTYTGPVIDSTDPNNIIRTYTVKVEIYNPWPGDFDGDGDGGYATWQQYVYFNVDLPHTVAPAAAQSIPAPGQMPQDTCNTLQATVTCRSNLTIKDVLKSIRLQKYDTTFSGKFLDLDLVTAADVASLETNNRIYRKVWCVDERRSSKTTNNAPICVFYAAGWFTGGAETPNLPQKDSGLEASCIPIRFPNCISDAEATAQLPVRGSTGAPYKAFARVGDLNQVLRFLPGPDPAGRNTWWREPWICIVCQTQRTQENNVKFDWMKNINDLDAPGAVAAARAANVLSVGGPWQDSLDNDGDGKTDFADTGKPAAGQTGGPECRVAGKINLNTATPDTLSALRLGVVGSVDLSGLTANRPFKSPAQILKYFTPPANASVEQRDAAFTLISNIATVRSDTFSVYGTVQIVDPSRAQKTNNTIDKPEDIIRTRRFWALVDRSPSLAYPPTDKTNFIYPRILNFQWLD